MEIVHALKQNHESTRYLHVKFKQSNLNTNIIIIDLESI